LTRRSWSASGEAGEIDTLLTVGAVLPTTGPCSVAVSGPVHGKVPSLPVI